MNDPIISLACSMHSKKGIYSLLLGSGISRSAGIPTGWEITLDLISKIAAANGKTEIIDYEEWYRETYNKEPDYSEILDSIAKKPAERNQILKKYFEPSDDNTDAENKKPTKAHKAIAELIKKGYIRFIISTNFDRLLEKALDEIGINPIVISTTDQLKGAMPLIHSECTILKIHGDYLDTRIKNTKKELEEYDKELNNYLDRVFDEFGLIICGWSGEWDTALRNSIYRIKNNRFSTYWLKKGFISEEAKKLIDFKKGEIIEIESADALFESFLEKISSLEDLEEKQTPLSIDLACATLKRLLPDTKNRIKINDLIMAETHAVIKAIENLDWSITPDEAALKKKIEDIESICEKLLHLVAIGCYWDGSNYNLTWTNMFKMITQIKCPSSFVAWSNLCRYPGLLIVYVILISCIASENYNLLYIILNETILYEPHSSNNPKPISIELYSENVIEMSFYNKAYGKNFRFPISEHLFKLLEKPMLAIIIDKNEYTRFFNKGEFFYSINYSLNEIKISKGEYEWAPIGRYRCNRLWNFKKEFQNEIELSNDWKALKAGFFNGSIDTFIESSQKFVNWMNTVNY